MPDHQERIALGDIDRLVRQVGKARKQTILGRHEAQDSRQQHDIEKALKLLEYGMLLGDLGVVLAEGSRSLLADGRPLAAVR